MKALPRNPEVENRYNLTYSAIQNLKVGNRKLVGPPLFFWNASISAWCIYEASDKQYRENTYWIGIFADNAPEYPGEFKFGFSSFTGICNYEFEEFFEASKIYDEYDLIIQEMFLKKINHLLDLGILVQE